MKDGKRLIFPGLRSQPSHSRESARNREKEREGRTGNPSLRWNKVASSDKDQKTRNYKLPRKQRGIEVTRPKGNPYQKRVIDNPFQHMEKPLKEIPCKHPISKTSVLGVACLLLSLLRRTDEEQRALER